MAERCGRRLQQRTALPNACDVDRDTSVARMVARCAEDERVKFTLTRPSTTVSNAGLPSWRGCPQLSALEPGNPQKDCLTCAWSISMKRQILQGNTTSLCYPYIYCLTSTASPHHLLLLLTRGPCALQPGNCSWSDQTILSELDAHCATHFPITRFGRHPCRILFPCASS